MGTTHRRQLAAIGAAAGLVLTLAIAPAASARTLVDPTTLTPPLRPSRVCYQLGPYVQCDTSGPETEENEPIGDFGCGVVYETELDTDHSTRWYQDGLIVRRAVQEKATGFWSLSPTGAEPIVTFQLDFSWDEHFTIPGDITSAVRVIKGSTLLVPQLGAEWHESGYDVLDTEDQRGQFSFPEDNMGALCPLLVG